MKYFLCFMFLFLSVFSIPLQAQYWLVGAPFIDESESIKGMSLGNSRVALKGYTGASHYNPAGVYHEFPTFSGYIDQNESNFGFAEFAYNNFSAGYHIGEVHFSTDVKFHPVEYSSSFVDDGYEANSFIINTSASYLINEKLSVGLGLNYLYNDLGEQPVSGPGIGGSSELSDRKLTLDLGALYETEYYSEKDLNIRQSFGLSLTDFGKGVKYGDNPRRDPLPMKLRIGSSVFVSTGSEIYGMKALSGSFSLGLSKVMARIEENVTQTNGFADTSYSAMPPLKALFKSWGPLEYYNGVEVTEFSLAEQIFTHIGTEIGFAETLYFRFGYQDVGEVYRGDEYTSFGFGIDLGYLQFDYAKFSYEENLVRDNDKRWQLTARIPLTGKRPDSILNTLFD